MATRITNISGNFGNATNWLTPDVASMQITSITQAQFLAEQPAGLIPPGHIDGNGILKVEMIASGGPYRLRGRNFTPVPIATSSNITARMFMPEDMADRWETIVAGNTVQFFYNTAAYPALTDYYTKSINWRPTLANVGMQPGNFHTTIVPRAWDAGAGTVGRLLSNVAAIGGTPQTGNMQWIEIDIRGDATAAPADPLVFYIFDIVAIEEDLPTLYFRWDDGSAGHALVSYHMRTGTKYAGGRFGSPLPSTFCIIEALVDTPGYVTSQDLRNMVSEGSTLCVHGNGATWSASSTTQIAEEIGLFWTRCNTENWPGMFKKMVTFPGNDGYNKTTDSVRIKTWAKTLSCEFNSGNAFFGYGFSLQALDDPINCASVVTIGQGATDINTSADIASVAAFMGQSKLSLCLMGHEVVAAAPGALGITYTEFDNMMEAVSLELISPTARFKVSDYVIDAFGIPEEGSIFHNEVWYDRGGAPIYPAPQTGWGPK